MSSLNELVDIIDEALAEFAHSECPYCQAYIGLDKYIDRTDIEKWLAKRNEIKQPANIREKEIKWLQKQLLKRDLKSD